MDREEGCWLGYKGTDHCHEPPCRDVIGDLPPGLLREAQSGKRPDHGQFRVGSGKRAGHPKISGAVAAAEAPLGMEMPFGVKDDTGMARALARPFWGPPPRPKIRSGH